MYGITTKISHCKTCVSSQHLWYVLLLKLWEITPNNLHLQSMQEALKELNGHTHLLLLVHNSKCRNG